MLAVGYALNSEEARELGVGVFPIEMAPKLAPLVGHKSNSFSLFERMYPFESGMLGESGRKSVNGILTKLDMEKNNEVSQNLFINEISHGEKINVDFSLPPSGMLSRTPIAFQSYSYPSSSTESKLLLILTL